ncbi:restriction endonuclease subunit S [Sinorhizobium fredii]|uniref:restriction endonuclease subunit S n=1 Tax=Rhizobium fredii TaxID=380 RepID=UPI0006860BCE|nr:restriction endonuclease subunit S [Sinorhizobium fredii]
MVNIDKLLTDHLDLWTSAIARKSAAGRGRSKKFSFYGIDKLRALILDLAVHGKLVPQDPSAKPCPELTSRIAKWKSQAEARLVKADAGRPPLPPGWVDTNFGAAFTLEYGTNLPDSKRSQTGEFPVFGSNGIVGTHHASNVDKPCLVVGRKGSAGAIQMCLADGCWVTDVSYYSVPPKGVDIHFAKILFTTLALDDLGKGIKPGLNRNEAYALWIAIPPLSEQTRIVAKVDELMALCDRLEAGTYEAIEGHQLLVKELLATLTAGRDAGELADNWAWIEAHFDALFVTEDSVDQLKQTILQLAVMGKLVPQDPKDEPASELLKRIKAENKELASKKGIRIQKPALPAKELDTESEIPRSWEYVYLQDLAYQITDGTHLTPKYTDSGKPFLSAQNVKPFRFLPDNHRFVSEVDFEAYRASRKPEYGDILMTRVGAGIGEAAVLDSDFEFAFYVSLCLIKIPTKHLLPEYLVLWLNSPEGREKSASLTYGKGTSQGNLNLGLIRTFPIPVAPLAEQLRIVRKVNELSMICEQLKSGLAAVNDCRNSFADTIVTSAAL